MVVGLQGLTVVERYSPVAVVAVALEVGGLSCEWVGSNAIIVETVSDIGTRI